MGMIFHIGGADSDRLFPIDLIPRIVAPEDWRPLQAGLTQRVSALEAFLHDAYGERAVVRDGVLPLAIEESPGLRAAGWQIPSSVVRCYVAGIDLIRDCAGRWAVLEDNLRVPSGIGYAIANRWLAARVLPELIPASRITPGPKMAVRELRSALTATSRALALVTAGTADSAFYEHKLLAAEMDIPLVHPAELLAADDGVWIEGPEPAHVEVLYRRIDEDELFGATGADGKPLGPRLLDAIRNRLSLSPTRQVMGSQTTRACTPTCRN